MQALVIIPIEFFFLITPAHYLDISDKNEQEVKQIKSMEQILQTKQNQKVLSETEVRKTS